MNSVLSANCRATSHMSVAGVLLLVITFLCLAGVMPVFGQVNYLSNPSFELGDSGLGWNGITDWIGNVSSGGQLAYDAGAHNGTNVMRMNAYGGASLSLDQRHAITAGQVYEVSGWLKTGTGNGEFKPTNGYAAILLRFYNNAGTSVGGNMFSERFGAGGATTWTRYSTGPCLAPAGAVTSRVTCYYSAGGDLTTNGYVYFDDMVSGTGTVSRAGALYNNGFETQPNGTWTNLPYWEDLGNDGAVATNYRRSGRFALSLYYPETLCAQYWPATPGTRYASGGYILSPGFSSTNSYGAIIVQYLNSAGAVIEPSYVSGHFNPTNPSGSWAWFEANGIAPAGTVTGRTLCVLLGPDSTFSGQLYFDDMTQRVVSSTGTISGLLRNPGFEDGAPGNAYDLYVSGGLTNWIWLGGTNGGFVTTSYPYEGVQSMSLTYPANMVGQRIAAVTGRTYIADGYISSPTNEKLANDAYGVLLMEFYSTSYQNGTSPVSIVESARFTSNLTAGVWHHFAVTNHAPWTGFVTCRVVCAVMGNTTGYNGAVYFDGLSVIETNIAIANSQSGALWNPGFEFTANGTVLGGIDNWQALGFDGLVDSTYTLNGQKALKITYPETLLAQYWSATPGYRYSSSAYASTPSGANKFTSSTNAKAMLLLQYLDITGTNILATYQSDFFTGSATADTWSNLLASGVAPAGTVTGRTVCALLGYDTAFGGAVWFDDVSQSLVSTGGTVSGSIYNGGFEDGTTGDAFFLSNGLPRWTWYGGSNAGFIVTGVSQSNNQSLTIVYPGNLAGQDFPAATGLLYSVEGYLYTPSASRMTGSTAYATILLEFFNSVGGTGTSVSVVNTFKLTNGTPADTWIKVGVTNRAPWVSGTWMTGRVSCALLGTASNYGGQVYFDSVSVRVSTSALANTHSGTIWNPGFEFTADGTKFPFIDSWTNLGEAGSVDSAYANTGSKALKIYAPETLLAQSWPATAGYRYSSLGYVYTPASGADRFQSATNTHGVVLLQFLDATGTNVLQTFESPYFMTNSSTGTWVPLAVTGKAPLGAVSGRTMLAILGTNTGFGGSLWFDDVSQSLVSTGGTTQSGAIFNGGFDDGIVGDCFFLSNNLPSWTWYGGSNAGFVVDSLAHSNGQSLTIVYPNNLASQDFVAQTALTYTVEGYLYTPSANRMTGSTAFATILLEFFNSVGGTGSSVSVVNSFKLTNGTPADTWIKVGVTNRAPHVGTWVTGRVSCVYLDTVGGTIGGQVYFDSVRVSVSTVAVANTTNGSIRNPGFEYSAEGTKLPYIDSWTGLGNAGALDSTYRLTGNSALKIYASETLLAQSWPATAGYRYSSSAYAFTPSETEGSDLLVNGALSLVGVAQAPTGWTSFDDGSHEADYWHVLSPTNAWMFYWGGGIYQDITSGFVPGERYKFGGQFFMEGSNPLRNGDKYGAIQVEFYNAADGLISSATAYPMIQSNSVRDTWFGSAGSANVPAGTAKIRVLVRCNVPTGGDGTFVADDIFVKKVPAVAERFVSPYDAHGVVLLQYLNSTGGVMTTYESSYFTGSSAAGAWTGLTAAGVAPVGTVSGRTLVAILGSSTGFSGSLWFDDVSSALVSTGATPAGLIYNGGFEDGIAGDCFFLSNNLPNWTWFGGSNAGFVVSDVSQSNNQSMTIVYPGNLAGQGFAASTGLLYAVEGYLYTPAANRMTGSTAYATILLEFFNSVGGTGESVSVVNTIKLTNGTPANTWIKVGVTNRAPWVGSWVTGRVSCALLGGAENFGGQVYFDSVSVRVTTSALANTQSGTIWNPGFEFSAGGTKFPYIDSWTNLGNAGSLDGAYRRTGNNALKIYASETLLAQSWPATAGYRYASSAYAYTPSETEGSDLLANGALSLVGVAQAPTGWTSFDDGSHEADYWHVLSPTNAWMFYWGGGIYQDVTTGFVPGERYRFGGAFFMEAGNPLAETKYGVIQLEFYDATDGLISSANSYPSCDSNSVRDAWFGTAGSASVPAGATKMRVIVRCNVPGGSGSGSFAADDIYLKKVPAAAERFVSPYGAHGVVLLQYMDATGTNVLQTFESPYFTTNSLTDSWVSMSVTGKAPIGTTSARTLLSVLGNSTGFSGSLWFDDVSQSLISTGGITQSGLIYNGGFDDGNVGDCYFLSNSLPYWKWLGGSNAGFVVDNVSHSNGQSLTIVYPDNLAAQEFTAGTGLVYVAEGYMYTPAASRMTGTTAYAQILLEFFNAAGGATSVSVVGSAKLTNGSPADTWIKVSVTNRAPWGGTWVTGRVACAMLGGASNYGGQVYFDSVRVTVSTSALANTQSGALWNPGFEFTADGTKLQFVDNWTGLGEAGGVGSSFTYTGAKALQIYAPETLSAQTWSATPGYRYGSTAYVATPATDRLKGASNLSAIVLVQYFDVTNGLLATYQSRLFTTNNPAGTWTQLTASGVAPMQTVYGRTVVGLLGTNAGFAGSVWFDDVSQSLISTGSTVSGVIRNGGLDDGITGNANYLSNDLPHWTWFGGTNAGFIADSASHSNGQSLVIVAANNLLSQDFAAVTGRSYVVEGCMMTPSSERMTSTTAYATFLLEFYNPQGNPTTSVSVVSTANLTNGTPADTWIKFSVTNHAPWVGPWVTGRVSCAVLDLVGTPFGGVVYFDSVRVTETNIAFANSQAGALWNPGFEYTAKGTKFPYMDNWTNLGFAGSVEGTVAHSGGNALKIYAPETLAAQTWAATSGWKYSTAAYAYTPANDRLQGVTNLHAVVLLQFFDATGTNILQTYESDYFMTNATAGTWSNLEAIGVAPRGTVSGRTVLGVLGTNSGFAGSVYFDDVTQRIVQTTSSVSGLIRNPGFDDTAPGNAYTLQQTSSLFNWTWNGGDNAGFIARDRKRDGQQSLVVTYPQNGASQDFTVNGGTTYKAEGYLLTPSTAKFQSDGDQCYGNIELAFFVNGSTNAAVNYVSAKFGTARPADQWIYFAVTGSAPVGVTVTGRLTCTIATVLGNPQDDLDLAGVIFFDQLSVTQLGGVTSVWEQWQQDNFGSTTGPNTGLNEDYDGDLYPNWDEFVAGTQPTNINSLLALGTQPQGSGSQFVIRWESHAGRWYTLRRATNILNGGFSVLQSGIQALPPMNTYTDSPPAGIERYYYRVSVTTNQP